VWITGTIGDSGLGLAALRGEAFDWPDRDYLVARYHLPLPRVALGAAIANLASAAMDVSDGLIADAVKLAAASAVRIEIDLDALPLSPAAARWVERQPDRLTARSQLAAFGDDYEILFSAVAAPGIAATRIGQVQPGTGVSLLSKGRPVSAPPAAGYVHRIGR
jgi:thiamine-monophosphate kinase